MFIELVNYERSNFSSLNFPNDDLLDFLLVYDNRSRMIVSKALCDLCWNVVELLSFYKVTGLYGLNEYRKMKFTPTGFSMLKTKYHYVLPI